MFLEMKFQFQIENDDPDARFMSLALLEQYVQL